MLPYWKRIQKPLFLDSRDRHLLSVPLEAYWSQLKDFPRAAEK
jgi:hypothetical protein